MIDIDSVNELQKASRLKGDQRMQLSMLVLWLLELMLRKLGSLKDAGIQVESPQYQMSWNALNRFTEQKRIMVTPLVKAIVAHKNDT